MCGRFTLYTDPEVIGRRFGLAPPDGFRARYNIAPSQSLLAVRQAREGREFARLHWGLVPFWAKSEKTGYSMINARAETLADKPAFRAAYRHRRCLIPADGFYEWTPGPDGKQPHYIRMGDGEVFALAGLWEHWEGEGRVLESCTIIVTQANQLMAPIHDRMPVIIHPDDYARWLDTDHFDAEALAALLAPYPGREMVAFPVSRHVNSPKHDDASCIVAR
jgi:putative SOS response-associated peptidase YedK